MLFHVLLLLSWSHSYHLLSVRPWRHLLFLCFLLFGRLSVIDDCKTNVSSFQRAHIVCSITAHQSEVTLLVQHAYNYTFLGRRSSRKNVHITNHRGSLWQ